MSRLLYAALTLASLAASLAGVARAQEPFVDVRGRMRLELEREEHTAEGVLELGGVLVEESLGEGMPARTVVLRIQQEDTGAFAYGYALRTDIDGAFTFSVPHLSHHRYRMQLTASAGDDPHYASAPAIERIIDMSRHGLELQVHAPAEHPASAPGLPIVIEAQPLDGAVRLLTDHALPVEIDIEGHTGATVVLEEGRASTTLALPAVAVGRELAVRVRFLGDSVFSPTEATVRVRIVEATTIQLTAERPRVSAGDEIALMGHLRIGDHPLGGVPIVVRRVADPSDPSDAPFVVAKTESDGTFRASLRAPLHGGSASIEASFPASEAKSRGLLPATSDIVVVEVVPAMSWALLQRRPSGLAIGVLVALAVALFSRRLLVAWRRRRHRLAIVAEDPTAAPPRKLFATLRMPSDRRVAGFVRDAERGRPLADAVLVVHVAGEEIILTTDANGRFALPECRAGAVEITASLPSHAPATTHGQVPHRGELAALELQLTPLRGELLRRYDDALAPFVVGERLGRRTPRELADAAVRPPHPKGKSPPPVIVVGAMRALVEQKCYGNEPVDPEALIELERITDPLRRAP